MFRHGSGPSWYGQTIAENHSELHSGDLGSIDQRLHFNVCGEALSPQKQGEDGIEITPPLDAEIDSATASAQLFTREHIRIILG